MFWSIVFAFYRSPENIFGSRKWPKSGSKTLQNIRNRLPSSSFSVRSTALQDVHTRNLSTWDKHNVMELETYRTSFTMYCKMIDLDASRGSEAGSERINQSPEEDLSIRGIATITERFCWFGDSCYDSIAIIHLVGGDSNRKRRKSVQSTVVACCWLVKSVWLREIQRIEGFQFAPREFVIGMDAHSAIITRNCSAEDKQYGFQSLRHEKACVFGAIGLHNLMTWFWAHSAMK